MTGTITDNVTIHNKNATILAGPGARLIGRADEDVIQVSGSSQVSIFDLEIAGTKIFDNGAGVAMLPGNTATLSLDRVIFYNDYEGIRTEAGTVNVVRCTFSDIEEGIAALVGGIVNISQSTFSYNGNAIATRDYTGTLNVTRSTISQNFRGLDFGGGTLTVSRSVISHNSTHGIVIRPGAVSFHIANNFVVRNGRTSSPFVGGIVASAAAGKSMLEFNTIVDNQAGNGVGPPSGIDCKGKIDTPNNLIFGNTTGQGDAQVSADCSAGNSLVTAPSNPGFRSSTDYHLSVYSPPTILNAVDCPGDLEDYDGDLRPQGGKCDLGADEYRP